MGSAPGDKMKKIGVVFFDSLKALTMSRRGD
jgi:hypothetical protein